MRSLLQVRSNGVVDYVLKIAIYALECLFTVGIIGSAIVVILTSIEDSEVFFSRNHESAPSADPAQPQRDE